MTIPKNPVKLPCLRCGKTLRKRDGICYCTFCTKTIAIEQLEASENGKS